MKKPRRARKYKNFAKALDRILETAPVIQLHSDYKGFILSDLHVSDHSEADDFKRNINLMAGTVLPHYSDREGFYAGDILELWEAKAKNILNHPKNTAVLWALHRNCRHWVVGNHDKKAPGIDHPILNHIQYAEAVRFVDMETERTIAVLIHGHQADHWNKGGFWTGVARWLVRYPWTWIQRAAGTSAEPEFSPARNPNLASAMVQSYLRYGKENNIILICGHTHRSCNLKNYVNVGSGIKPGIVQVIEINGKEFSKATWRD